MMHHLEQRKRKLYKAVTKCVERTSLLFSNKYLFYEIIYNSNKQCL